MICRHRRIWIPKRRNRSGGRRRKNVLTRSLITSRKSVSILSATIWEHQLTGAERLALLCHILMNCSHLHHCTTNDLKAAIQSDRTKLKPIEKERILEDVWKIGYQLERFRGGGIGRFLALVFWSGERANCHQMEIAWSWSMPAKKRLE